MHYYKATDGRFTVFRGSKDRAYRSAWIQAYDDAKRIKDYGFSMKLGSVGAIQAVEISKAEFQFLNRCKIDRIVANGGDPKYAAAGDSWVRNVDLPAVELFKETSLPVEPGAIVVPAVPIDPTKTTYLSLIQAYEYLNTRLFDGKLPSCLVTLQRKANCRGYFAGARFVTRDGAQTTDEIALNPATFKERNTACILSTLAHEMCHLEQHHFGKPGKGGYHNKEWGQMMLAIGLTPVSIDQPGKQVGNKLTHEVVPGGRFVLAADELINQGVAIDYVEAWTETGKAKAAKKLKVKYSCPECGQNCWAKPDSRFVCGDCETEMEAEES
jgi:predicted SprT family Zn-dependent metalloprotease